MFQMFLDSKLKDMRLQGKYDITTSSVENFSNGCNKIRIQSKCYNDGFAGSYNC
jgi:hypothetical protein